MLQEFRLRATQLLNNSNARAVLILSTLLIAALLGGAPYDFGGG